MPDKLGERSESTTSACDSRAIAAEIPLVDGYSENGGNVQNVNGDYAPARLHLRGRDLRPRRPARRRGRRWFDRGNSSCGDPFWLGLGDHRLRFRHVQSLPSRFCTVRGMVYSRCLREALNAEPHAARAVSVALGARLLDVRIWTLYQDMPAGRRSGKLHSTSSPQNVRLAVPQDEELVVGEAGLFRSSASLSGGSYRLSSVRFANVPQWMASDRRAFTSWCTRTASAGSRCMICMNQRGA